jgi:protein ImuA
MSTFRAKTLARLREQIRTLEKPRLSDRRALEFGDPAIDDELPGGGLASGCLHELAASPQDAAAYGLIAVLLGRLIGDAGVGPGMALWCRLAQSGHKQRGHKQSGHKQSGHKQSGLAALPYGPGLVRFGLPVERLILVRAGKPADLLWAMEEGLRSGRFTAVLGEGIAPDLTATRRLQLAAEAGGATALLAFPASEHRSLRLSAATTRWRIAACPAVLPDRPRWSVSLERCRNGGSRAWTLEWCHEALRLRVSAALADRSLATAAL